jgi:hypothetical protein
MNHGFQRHATLLKRALTANAAFSSLCALVFLAGSNLVADLVGAPRAEILFVGVNLVVFVAMILTVLTRPDVTRRWVLGLAVLIASLDVLWVLTTPLMIAAYSPVGRWIFAAIALCVASFAVVQIRALYGIIIELRHRVGNTRRTT